MVNLSMAERLSANMKIMAKLSRVHPETEKAQVKQQASAMEGEIYKSCTSSDDYQTQVEALVDSLTLPEAQADDRTTTSDSYAPEIDRPVERIGPYTATYHASGLFSTIYRSTSNTPDQNTIAIKLTTPAVMSPPHNSYKEGRLLRLAARDTIVPIYTSESVGGGHYILTMPFLPYDFGSLLDRGKLTKTQIKSHLRSLFDGLAHCHDLGILHRDIKPSNILLASTDGPAYLADFGIAWKNGDPDSEAVDAKITDIGTTCYRGPELLFGNSAYGEGVDIWAAGCVVAEAENNGKSLFDSGDVGSELALIKSIFSTIGTPTDASWPEAKSFPDWGKMAFREYPAQDWEQIIPKASERGRDLVQRLVRYESSQRLSASEALKHPYFDVVHPS